MKKLTYKTIKHVLLFVLPVLIIGASSDASDNIKPEMIVRFTKSGIACLNRDHLQEIVAHVIKGENTKADAMMIQNGGDCIMLAPSRRFKVLSVEYNKSDLDFGLWTFGDCWRGQD